MPTQFWKLAILSVDGVCFLHGLPRSGWLLVTVHLVCHSEQGDGLPAVETMHSVQAV